MLIRANRGCVATTGAVFFGVAVPAAALFLFFELLRGSFVKRDSQKISGSFYEKLTFRREQKRQKKKKELITLSIVSACILLILAIIIAIGVKHERDANKGINDSTPTLLTESNAVDDSTNMTEPINDEESSSFDQVTTSVPETSTGLNDYIIAPPVSFDASQISEYSGSPFCEINSNVPFFTDTDYTTHSYEYYSPLDNLGRCGYAVACIGPDLIPDEPRGEIGNVRPSGWHTQRYDDLIEDRYLYNRCHLIAYQLTGENDNPENLITGTRYMNIEGMLPFENTAYDYVTYTGNHILYRSTPIFEGDNLVATGVLMEAHSVEDNGEGLSFCVFTYNVQPGIVIDYATGDSQLEETPTEATTEITRDLPINDPVEDETESEEKEVTYILNSNTGKFHYPSCSSVKDMKEKNKVYFYGTREEAIAKGYVPCKRCNP